MPVYNVVLRGVYLEQAVVASRYYRNTTPGAVPDSLMLENLATLLAARYTALCNASMSLESLHVRDVTPGSVGFDFIPSGWPVVGTMAGAPLPSFVAGRINYIGQTLAHPYRGYTRAPGLVEEDMTGQNWVAGAITRLTAVGLSWSTIILGLGDIAWEPVLYSPTTGISNPIASHSASSRVTTQNSRKVGHGG